jgi:hypothetical protein
MAAAATITAAAVVIAVAPAMHSPAIAGRKPAGAALAPPGSTAGPVMPPRGRPAPPTLIAAQARPTAMPVAARCRPGPPRRPHRLRRSRAGPRQHLSKRRACSRPQSPQLHRSRAVATASARSWMVSESYSVRRAAEPARQYPHRYPATCARAR